MSGPAEVWRRELPHVVAALTRRHGRFDDAEDAAQLAALAAHEQWPVEGVPHDPRAWLLAVASRRLVDQVRSEQRRHDREERHARLQPGPGDAPPADATPAAEQRDDLLELMVLCCHPSLSRSSQVALVLRAVGGLTTREVAAGFLVPEATMAQRVSRAKTTLAAAGARLEQPSVRELPERLLAVRHAVSLLYTQGHRRSEGTSAVDVDLRADAIGLARRLMGSVPADPENAGLLALLLLSEARAAALVDDHGDLVPLEDQDRGRWDRALVVEGVDLLERTLPRGHVGTFQLQAAIAAVHAEAATYDATDWPQVLALYEMLRRVEPSVAATIGWATALAEVEGPQAGLDALAEVTDPRQHRAHAVRGHLLARLGRVEEAREALALAARLTRSIPEQRHLHRVLADLA